MQDPHEIEGPDELHRRIARPGPDGRVVEVLAARRGVMMRPGHIIGGGGGVLHDSLNPLSILMSLLVQFVVRVVADMAIEGAARGRPWKVKAYRTDGWIIRRLSHEVLPAGVEPEARMQELLDELAPASYT